MSLTFTLHDEATLSSEVISKSLVQNVVGMARAALRSADIEDSGTCLVSQMLAQPTVATPAVSSASVISSLVSCQL